MRRAGVTHPDHFLEISMSKTRLPTYFISHGGGPWPYMPHVRARMQVTCSEFGIAPDTQHAPA